MVEYLKIEIFDLTMETENTLFWMNKYQTNRSSLFTEKRKK